MSSRSRLRSAAIGGIALGAIASLGVLAALPSYRDYATRGQISDGLDLATPYKTAVIDAWRSNGQRFAAIDTDSIRPALERTGKYVRSVDIVSGAIVITYGDDASPPIRGRSLTIVPALNEERAVEWQCGYGGAPIGFESIFDAPSRLTDVPEQYLPPDCRH